MRSWRASHGLVGALLLFLGGSFPVGTASAMCNVIPGATGSHRGALGALNRPFASPDELIGIDVNRGICDAASPGLSATPDAHVVTLLFEPRGGVANVVVVAKDCASLAAKVTACEGQLAGGRATCVPAGAGDLIVVDRFDTVFRQPRRRLFVRLPQTNPLPAGSAPPVDFGLAPGHSLAGPVTVAVTAPPDDLPCGLASQRCADTAGMIACVDEIYELDGTCDSDLQSIDSVFGHFTVLPPPNDYGQVCTTPGVCAGTTPDILFTTDAEGHVLIPWDYSAVLVRENGVPVARVGQGGTNGFEGFVGSGAGVRVPTIGFVTSHAPEGFPLPPLFTPLPEASDEATLFGTIDADLGVMRIARTSRSGGECSPASDFPAAPCIDDVDCPNGTCQAGPGAVCSGGVNAGGACTRDSDCPGAMCPVAALFEFRDRYEDGGVGPVVLPSANYALQATTPVPLDGLNETHSLFSFVLSEGVSGVGDLNGDGDPDDFIVTLSNRDDGSPQPIGNGVNDGRAVTRLTDGNFGLPAVAVEGDFLAFFESEPREGGVDANGDGDAIDSVVRAFELDRSEDPPVPVELTPVFDPFNPRNTSGLIAFAGGNITLEISDGLLFYGANEGLGVPIGARRVSRRQLDGFAGNGRSIQPALTPDARYVAFASQATNLVVGDGNGDQDIFVHDRDTDGDQVFDEAGFTNTDRVNILSDRSAPASLGGFGAEFPAISADGRHVVFQTSSDLTNTIGIGDFNGVHDIYVHDRDADPLGPNGVFDEPGGIQTKAVSVDANGLLSTGTICNGLFLGSFNPRISPSGRFVVFTSFAGGMDPSDTNNQCDPANPLAIGGVVGVDVYVHDRDLSNDGAFDADGDISTVRVSVASDGSEAADGNAFAGEVFVGQDPAQGVVFDRYPLISSNGQYVAFNATSILHSADLDHCSDGYLHDRDTDGNGVFDEPGGISTVLVSRPYPGAVPVCDAATTTDVSAITPDGRYVTFSSVRSTIVPGDTNGVADIFVYDRVLDRVTRESLTSAGEQANAAIGTGNFTGSFFGLTADNGSFVTFGSHSTNLVPDDIEGFFDRFTRIRATGLIVRNGIFGSDSTIAFNSGGGIGAFSVGTPLDADDTNGLSDAFVGVDFPRALDDYDGDGDFSDSFLRVIDLRDPAAPPINLPADGTLVTTDRGSATFVRAEFDFLSGSGTDLNGDGDSEDLVAQLYDGRDALDTPAPSATNLGRAATALDLSSAFVAALVPEAGQGDTDFNLDSDRADAQLQVYSRSLGQWLEADIADAIAAIEPDPAFFAPYAAAFIAPEAADGGTDHNGDGDAADRVLRLVSVVGNAATLHESHQAAEEFVVGTRIVAFRTPEASQGAVVRTSMATVTRTTPCSRPSI